MSNLKNINVEEIEKERKDYTTRGTSGFANIGNTCYMNSTLQCLGATDLLVAYFTRLNPDGRAEYVQDLKQGIARIISEEIKKQRLAKGLPIDQQITVNGKFIKQKFRNSLTYELKRLLTTMWGVNCVLTPREFKNVLERENKKEKINKFKAEFNGYKQCDSQECFSFIIDRVHEETLINVELGLKTLSNSTKEAFEIKNTKSEDEYNIYKKDHLKDCAVVEALESWEKYISKSYSIIEDIFGGMSYQSITCQKCGHSSLKFDPFKAIILPIPNKKNITIENCLQTYFEDEKMDGDNQTFCDICKCKNDSMKINKIWYCPHRLMICFKRFDNNGNKNNKTINFPIEGLDMNQYTSGFVNGNNIYDLYAISYHSGSLGGGHYTAYTLNAMNNKWYHHDDEHTIHVNIKLKSEQFEEFFKDRITENDKNTLKKFIDVKLSSVAKRYGDNDCYETIIGNNKHYEKCFGIEECNKFLEILNCKNTKEILDDYEREMKNELEKELITPGAYWLLYKKREKYNFAKYADDLESDSDTELYELDKNNDSAL